MCQDIFIDLLNALKKCIYECRDKLSIERNLRNLIVHVSYCDELSKEEKIELLSYAIEELMKIQGDNSIVINNKIYAINKIEKEIFKLKKEKTKKRTSRRRKRK